LIKQKCFSIILNGGMFMAEKTEAQKRAQKSYMSKFIRLEFRATLEQRDTIRAQAAARGESVNAFIGRAIQEAMERDNMEG